MILKWFNAVSPYMIIRSKLISLLNHIFKYHIKMRGVDHSKLKMMKG